MYKGKIFWSLYDLEVGLFVKNVYLNNDIWIVMRSLIVIFKLVWIIYLFVCVRLNYKRYKII